MPCLRDRKAEPHGTSAMSMEKTCGGPNARERQDELEPTREDAKMIVRLDEASGPWRVVDDNGAPSSRGGFATDAAARAWFDASDACLKN